jgi:hypothetical protein
MEPKPSDHQSPWSRRSLLFVAGVLIAIAASIVLSTAPFAKVLGPSTYALGSALHGACAFMLMLVSTIGLYLAWRLFMGKAGTFPDLQLLTTVMATLSLLTVVSGNWIYIAYRAKTPDSPRSYFLAQMSEVHTVFFEFKEFASLFTLPLSIAVAFIVSRYGRQILERSWTRTVVAVLMALVFFYFMIGFALGAAVTKLRSI